MRIPRGLCATPLVIAGLSMGLPGIVAAEDCTVVTADGKTIHGRVFEGMIRRKGKKDFTLTKGGEMVKFVPYQGMPVTGKRPNTRSSRETTGSTSASGGWTSPVTPTSSS